MREREKLSRKEASNTHLTNHEPHASPMNNPDILSFSLVQDDYKIMKNELKIFKKK